MYITSGIINNNTIFFLQEDPYIIFDAAASKDLDTVVIKANITQNIAGVVGAVKPNGLLRKLMMKAKNAIKRILRK